jgi:hypothetical protein
MKFVTNVETSRADIKNKEDASKNDSKATYKSAEQ